MQRAFTLIELLISLAIATIITAAIYFSLDTALESWNYSRDQMAIQKVLSEVMDEIISGTLEVYGLQDSLEIKTAQTTKVEFVPPWTDDNHSAASGDFVYTLDRRIKPGTGVPIGEIKLPDSDEYESVPVKTVDLEDALVSQVRLGIPAPAGSQVRFIYFPDAKTDPDTAKTIWWDSQNQQVYVQDINDIKNISKNPFDVKITKMRLNYYDNANTLITDFDAVDEGDLSRVTGIEVYLEAELGQNRQSLISFINLRNAPMRSGYLVLRQGMKFPVPNSHNVHTLLLQNISGVSSGDELELMASPQAGKSWRIRVRFGRVGLAKPVIESYSIEYPADNPVYTEYPRVSAEAGLNLLTIASNGLYDYDDDDDIEDFVILEGDGVMMEVTKMDIAGAGLFVRP